MTEREALQFALETLEIWKGYMPALWDKTDEQAITAIKEALAQPEQEPVIVGRWPSAAIGMETLQDALKRENGTPPQRTWVEIDGDDWIKALEMADFDKVAAFEFFENKLKELNT